MQSGVHRYFILNKPYNMVSQFVSPDRVRLLGDLDFDFPEGTHAVGRLDNHSEGLLLLTTNKKVTRLLFQGDMPHRRTYLVRVKNIVSPETLEELRKGVRIRTGHEAFHVSAPVSVSLVERPDYLNYEGPPLHANGRHSWLQITLTEGKFHQVRKMVAAVHHRCQRLIRISIEDLELGDLKPGQVRELSEENFFRLLRIGH